MDCPCSGADCGAGCRGPGHTSRQVPWVVPLSSLILTPGTPPRSTTVVLGRSLSWEGLWELLESSRTGRRVSLDLVLCPSQLRTQSHVRITRKRKNLTWE